MPHPLAGVGTLPFSGGMLMPPFGLPPGALIMLATETRFKVLWMGG